MKKFVAFFAIISSLSFTAQKNNVVVNGHTNVSTFKCVNDDFNDASNRYSFRKNQLPSLQLEVNNFDCNNRIMTSDMRKTLKAEQYPKMYVKFLSFRKINSQLYKAKIEVKLTNRTRYFDTSFYPSGDTFVGKENVRFSDFGLKAPTKMGGMIVVKDELDLVLTLNNY